MKKFLTVIIIGLPLVILLSILIVGIGDNNFGTSNKDYIKQYDVNANDIKFDDKNGGGPKIKVYLTKEDKITEMFLEEYVRGVISAEMPAEFNIEALKAQAVAARTYALSHMKGYGNQNCDIGKGADICDTVHCQAYMGKEERLKLWPQKTSGSYWNKITEAVMKTEGEIMKYDGKLVLQPYYFSTSDGRTENSKDIFNIDEPYLKSVVSYGDEASNKYKNLKKISYSSFVNTINNKYNKAGITTNKVKNQIVILNRFQGGSVNQVKIANLTITGSAFRNLFNLDSENFSFKFNTQNIEITCKGYGHDVGMSQWGANSMGKAGSNYQEILKHYYQGITVSKI